MTQELGQGQPRAKHLSWVWLGGKHITQKDVCAMTQGREQFSGFAATVDLTKMSLVVTNYKAEEGAARSQGVTTRTHCASGGPSGGGYTYRQGYLPKSAMPEPLLRTRDWVALHPDVVLATNANFYAVPRENVHGSPCSKSHGLFGWGFGWEQTCLNRCCFRALSRALLL